MGKATTPSFVATVRLHVEPWQSHILDKRFNAGRLIYNDILNEAIKRIRRMRHSAEYRQIQSERKLASIHLKNDSESKIKKVAYTAQQKEVLKELNRNYGVNEYALTKYSAIPHKVYSHLIDAVVVQKIAKRVWSAVDAILFKKGKQVRFKRYGEMSSLEAREVNDCLKFRDGYVSWNNRNWKEAKPIILKPILPKRDAYLREALANKLKYVRLVRDERKGKIYYYAQFTLEGVPPIKRNRDTGFVKHKIGQGAVGIDIGIQTIAIASENHVRLTELAPQIENIEKQKSVLLRKLDRSRRATNQGLYQEDGTIKKGRYRWIKSKSYVKTQQQLATLQRLIRVRKKQEHEAMTNKLLALGNTFLVEDMDYASLTKRTKETKTSEKTGRYLSKKRYGKSISNKAPAMLLTILENKLNRFGGVMHRILPKDMKASQYNHLTDEYIKKDLNERFASLSDEIKIQRDMYSAYLIQHWDVDSKKYQKNALHTDFEVFRVMHEQEITRVKCEEKRISSFGM